MDYGTEHVGWTDRDEVEAANVRQLAPTLTTHVGFSSSMYFQAALSASVLLALYQCIRQASTPFSLTSSIDCWFQSFSVKVWLPSGSRFSRILPS